MQEAGFFGSGAEARHSSLWFWGDLVKAFRLTKAAVASSEEHPMCYNILLPDELGSEL